MANSVRRPKEVAYVTVKDYPNPDLGVMHRALPPNNSMRHPPIKEFEGAYQQCRAAVMLVNGKPAGFVKLTERPDKRRREELGLPKEIPNILELGGAIILPEFRGHSLYAGLNKKLLETHRSDIQSHKVLVMGVTVTIPFLFSFGKGIPEGMSFKFDTLGYFHKNHPILAGLLCSCDPEDRYRDIFRLRHCPSVFPPTVINTSSAVMMAFAEKEIYAASESGTLVNLRDNASPIQTSVAVTFISDVALGHKIEMAIQNSLRLPQTDAESFRRMLRQTGYYGALNE